MATKEPFRIEVSSRYGAPMGRRCDLVQNFEGRKTHLKRVPFVDYCYDPGGAYWGMGQPLYCAWSEATETEDYIVTYLRANNREAAKAELEGAIFYR